MACGLGCSTWLDYAWLDGKSLTLYQQNHVWIYRFFDHYHDGPKSQSMPIFHLPRFSATILVLSSFQTSPQHKVNPVLISTLYNTLLEQYKDSRLVQHIECWPLSLHWIVWAQRSWHLLTQCALISYPQLTTTKL